MEAVSAEPPTLVPSVVVTIILVTLWADYAYGAIKYYRRSRGRGAFREYVVSVTVSLVAIALGAAILAEYLPPPQQHDPTVITAIATGRVILLIVGAWLAWDRRRAP